MCCVASSAGPSGASSSSPTRPSGYGWAANQGSRAPSSASPSSARCSAGGQATRSTHTSGSSGCSRCCTPRRTPRYTLTVTNVDPSRQAVRLSGRPFPTPLDPATCDACLLHRVELHTLNPHLVVTGVTRTRDTPAHSTYLTRALASSGTTPSACRQTRLAQLVTDLDPKLTATALGMHDTGLVRYLADNLDHDRIKRTIR